MGWRRTCGPWDSSFARFYDKSGVFEGIAFPFPRVVMQILKGPSALPAFLRGEPSDPHVHDQSMHRLMVGFCLVVLTSFDCACIMNYRGRREDISAMDRWGQKGARLVTRLIVCAVIFMSNHALVLPQVEEASFISRRTGTS